MIFLYAKDALKVDSINSYDRRIIYCTQFESEIGCMQTVAENLATEKCMSGIGATSRELQNVNGRQISRNIRGLFMSRNIRPCLPAITKIVGDC